MATPPRLIRRIPISDTGLFLTVWVRSTSNSGVFGALNERASADQWPRILAFLSRYYEAMANEINDLAVSEFEKTRRRGWVATNRLKAALTDERNMFIPGSKDALYVGVPGFLDNSQAKYWRQIEEGSRVHVGRLIHGVWGSKLSGGWAQGRTGRYALASSPYSPHGKGSGQKFQPLSTMEGTLSEVRRKHPGMSTEARIGRAIPKSDYYTKAWEQFRRTNRPLQLLRAAFTQQFGLKAPTSYEGLMNGILDNT